MNSRFILLFFLLSQTIYAQTFTEMPSIPFEGVEGSSIAFSDVNGDGDDDVIITGLNSSDERIAKLYTNDGMGNFTEVAGTSFAGVWFGSVAFSDVNGDGSDDVIITGESSSNELIAKLYTNDGFGNFTEVAGTPFAGVWFSSVTFSDVNGDSNVDVLITGMNSSNEPIAKLYSNDGMGNFTEMTGTPFDSVQGGSVAFSDVNNDGNDDVLITGENSSGELIAKLYTNDGMGNFTEVMDTSFDGIAGGSIAFSDVNGDGNDDVLISGINNSWDATTKLYTNDGTGNFTEVMGTPFENLRESRIAFSDANNDGNDDVLITGEALESIAKLYTNDGMGNFTEVMSTPFDGVSAGSIAFLDVNDDGANDVIITGRNSSDERIAKLYINDETVSSTNDFIRVNSLDIMPFPNPVTFSTLYMYCKATEAGEAIIKVYNTNGVLLQQQREFATKGQQIFPINTTCLSPGTYLIELSINKKNGITKVIVQ